MNPPYPAYGERRRVLGRDSVQTGAAVEVGTFPPNMRLLLSR